MSAITAPAFLTRRAASRRGRSKATNPWIAPQGVHPIEVFAPDRGMADLLVGLAPPLFRAEIVPGVVWIVRLHPVAKGAGWVLELLALLERWLESGRRPWVTVVYGGRNYLVRAGGTRA
jgi:hypothetical protein